MMILIRANNDLPLQKKICKNLCNLRENLLILRIENFIP